MRRRLSGAWWLVLVLSGLAWLGTPRQARAQTTRPPARPRQRPGSAPTPPVRYISPDPRDPVGPPPPGATNPGQPRVPGTSHRPVPNDTVGRAGTAPADTSRLVGGVRGGADSLTVGARRKGQVETTVKYAAKDSIQFDVTNKVARLYSKASVDYGAMNLKAALITVNYGQNTMLAEGRRDSVKNREVDRPVFKDGDGLYTAGKIAYNFKTKRGKIAEAVTQQGEGYVSAETLKKTPDNELYGLRGRYTTCNLEHPHFYIQASKMKVTRKQVITGPFNLVIGGVPTPLGLPFGYFPKPDRSRGSGVLIPTFGQAADRGYFLTNGGYYFAPNDYMGVRLTGDIYAGNGQTFGGWGATANIDYLSRYSFSGNFNVRFTNRPGTRILAPVGQSAGPEYLPPRSANTISINWQHAPKPKPGGGRFAASVNISSFDAYRQTAIDARRFLSSTFASSISYDKQLRNLPINYRIQLSQSQNNQTRSMDFTLPDLSVGVARQYPYQWLGLAPRGRFYEQFAISYNLTAQNKLSNVVQGRSLDGLPLLGGSTGSNIIPLSLSNVGKLFRNAQNGMKHDFAITLGTYNVAKHFRLNPTVSYGEVWYGQRLTYSPVPLARAVRIDTARGFYRASSYTAGLSLSTAFYGTAIIKGKTLEAIRHKVTPSLNYAYSPDFTTNENNYALAVAVPNLVDAAGRPVPGRDYQRFNGFLYGTPGGRRVSSLSFNLQNSVEAKLRNRDDSTGTNPFRKVSIIDGLDINGSYDFAADSFKLSRAISVIFRTQIAQKLNVIANATFNPYQRDSTGREINRYLFDQPGGRRKLARLSAASLQMTYAFNPATGQKRSAVPRAVAPANDPTLGTPGPPALYADYVDFTIPWELNLTYNVTYAPSTRPLRGLEPRPPLFANHTLGLTGSIKLTDNLRFSYNAGYDLVNQTITYPNLTFFRDLHCWQISGTWIPLGITRGYQFTIAAKSSLLQDLKLNRNRYQQFQ